MLTNLSEQDKSKPTKIYKAYLNYKILPPRKESEAKVADLN